LPFKIQLKITYVDVKTIIFVLFLINLSLGVFTYFIKRNHRELHNFKWWIIANFIGAFSYLLVGLRTHIPDLLSIVLANTMLVGGSVVRIYGFKKFFNLPLNRNEFFLWCTTLVLFFGSFYYLTFINESTHLRSIIALSVFFALSTQIALLLLKHKTPKESAMYNVTAGAFFLFIFIIALRIISWFVNPIFRDVFYNSLFNYLLFASIVVIDITWTILFLYLSLQKATDKQTEIETRYQQLAENISDGVLIFGKDYTISYVSPSYLHQLGYTENEEIARNMDGIYLFIHPDERDELFDKIYKAIERKEPNLIYVYRVKNKAGKFIWREDNARFKYDSEGNYQEAFVICRDISERIQIEEQIKKLSIAVEQSPTTIVITNTEGEIEYVNPKFTELTGYTATEAIGNNPSILKSGKTDVQVFKDLWKTIREGNTWHGEFINKKKNGEEFIEQAIISPIYHQKQKIVGYIAIKENITERKQAERTILAQNEQLAVVNATKDKFFSIIAHDLKNPFSTILGFTELLIKNLHKYDVSKIESQLTIIRKSSQFAYDLLINLLEWARMQKGEIKFQPKVVEIRDLINENIAYADSMARKKNIDIAFSFNANYQLFCDKNMIDTVLRNLLSNAIKYTPMQGLINVSVTSTNNVVEVSVSDNGVGIDEKSQKLLFKIGESKSTNGTEGERGTGLGLVLCKDFVEKNGGRIWVESQIGKGSDFKFSLPLYTGG